MAYKVSLSQFAHIVGRMGKDLEDATIRGIQSAAYRLEDMIPESIQDSKPHAPIDNTVLFNSHFTQPTPRGAIVGVSAPHAAFMEYGTRPHWPPLMPIAEWAYRKDLIDVPLTEDDIDEFLSRFKIGSKASLGMEGEDKILQQEIDNAVMVVIGVARKIATKGIEPRRFFRRAISKFGRRRILEQQVQKELDKIGYGEVGRRIAGDLADSAAASARARKKK